MSKAIASSMAALVLLALLTGCSVSSSGDSNAIAPSANNTPNSNTTIHDNKDSGDDNTHENLSLIVYGNTSGNITNGAIAAQDGDAIYYV
jgi:hypothetical protein